MSTALVIQDSCLRPELFHWHGPIAAEKLNLWLKESDLAACPKDLRLLWKQTGGGDLLETETILGPFGDPVLGDAVLPVNRDLRLRGLPDDLVVFHTGTTTSAVDRRVGDYVELDRSNVRALRRFRTLDEWYAGTIRSALGARYGLR